MAKLSVALIRKGLKPIDAVPLRWRDEVQALLEAVMGAFTWEDIENIMRSLYKKIMLGGNEETGERSPLIQRAEHMIEEYYSQGITMEEVARKLGVSPEYLSRQFKKETGISFTEEIRNVKVER